MWDDICEFKIMCKKICIWLKIDAVKNKKYVGICYVLKYAFEAKKHWCDVCDRFKFYFDMQFEFEGF